jgi:hypothetical protein
VLAASIWTIFCVLNYSYVYYSEKNKPNRIADSFKKRKHQREREMRRLNPEDILEDLMSDIKF